ncbi:radical SAM family heme chaperone HemW [Savagea faecisuis]|uniref:Heme chaperone HemW n=1 Tax=Savagea faecisuis TaxID=1274803 RepID=A0ABW3GXJ2_9BACL
MRGLYIHIPFCHQICFYCDFNKVFYANQPVDAYIEALGVELQQYAKYAGELETVFIGGGTPTALTVEQLDRLLTLIERVVDPKTLREYTIEANPDELTREKLQLLYARGVHRLSIGVQSFNDELLKKIGRTHSAHHVEEVIQTAREVGFENISIDLIYALPEQTMDDWKETVRRALALDLPHYSAYSLIIEPKTRFYNLKNNDQLKLVDASVEGEMFTYVMEQMERAGRIQYEVSNFARPGAESIHNLIYWENDEYGGVGAGAHGYLDGERYSNIGPLTHYLKAVEAGERPVKDTHQVTLEERMEEEMFLGLRTRKGVSSTHFEKKFGQSLQTIYGSVLQLLIEDGYIVYEAEHYRLTEKGLYNGNDVFEQFLLME